MSRHSAQATQLQLPRSRNPGPSRPWITKELLSSIKEKHKKYRIYLKHKSDHNRRQFTTIRNNVTTLLRNAKSVFVQSTSTDTQRNTRLHHMNAELAPSLATLYNLSFQTGDIPQDWKDATVSPIYKKVPKPPLQTIAPSPFLA